MSSQLEFLIFISLLILGCGATSLPCTSKEIEDCRCYPQLVKDVITNGRNQYNMQKAFFPPNKANPVFIEIMYYFSLNDLANGSTNYSDTSVGEAWYWSESTFYLFQPIESLQFTSLLFTDNQLRKEFLTLYLPPNCFKENDIERDEMIQLLTQRLKLYAIRPMSTSVVINDGYSPKAESVSTIIRYYSETPQSVMFGLVSSAYALVFQIVFPCILIVCIFIFFVYRINPSDLTLPDEIADNSPKPAAAQQDNSTKLENDDNVSAIDNMNGIIMCVCSCTVVVYVLGLDIAALGRSAAVTRGHIFQWFSYTYLWKYTAAQSGIPISMLFEDIIIMALTITFACFKLCNSKKCNSKKCCSNCAKVSNAYVLLGPVSCIVVHSFHILVGFIHAPYHATSILVLYSVVFFVYIFAMKSTYHLLAKAGKITSGNERNRCRRLRDCCINCCRSRICVVICMLILSIILFIGFAMIYMLLLFVPINLATEDGPTRINSINQTILALITAAVTYKLFFKHDKHELVQILINAKAKISPAWSKKLKKRKKEEMEKLIYDLFEKTGSKRELTDSKQDKQNKTQEGAQELDPLCKIAIPQNHKQETER